MSVLLFDSRLYLIGHNSLLSQMLRFLFGKDIVSPRRSGKSELTVTEFLCIGLDNCIVVSLQGCPPFPRQIGPVNTLIGREKELSIIRTNYEAKRRSGSDSPIIQVEPMPALLTPT